MSDNNPELLSLLSRIAVALEDISDTQQDIGNKLTDLARSVHAIAVTYEDSHAIH